MSPVSYIIRFAFCLLCVAQGAGVYAQRVYEIPFSRYDVSTYAGAVPARVDARAATIWYRPEYAYSDMEWRPGTLLVDEGERTFVVKWEDGEIWTCRYQTAYEGMETDKGWGRVNRIYYRGARLDGKFDSELVITLLPGGECLTEICTQEVKDPYYGVHTWNTIHVPETKACPPGLYWPEEERAHKEAPPTERETREVFCGKPGRKAPILDKEALQQMAIVRLVAPISLRQLTRALDIKGNELYLWNYDYPQYVAGSYATSYYSLKLPKDKLDLFMARKKELEEKSAAILKDMK
ncbi:MAG: hypothetical protein JNL72_08140 [Flavipsychrobacter sp.]|nr:hypothetical protein [Flavipsychrobacter sp.]